MPRMESALAMTYIWLKAGHLIFVIFWMAGLFMLPRYLVYHQEALDGAGPGSAEDLLWIERTRRLVKIILAPSIVVVWVLGILLATSGNLWGEPWLHAKLLLVLLLSGYHGWMAGYAKKLARGERPLSGKQLRLLNEVPGLAAALIVVLVVVRPF
jgi:protoporphyrinogen IX oxidase